MGVPLLIIDMHAHVFPDRLAPAAVETVAGRAGITASHGGTLDALRQHMRAAGIAWGVLQPVASKAAQVRSINDWAAGIVDDGLIPFGAIHPDVEDIEAEMAWLAARGFGGVKLHPEYQSFRPLDERLEALYDAAVRHNMIVYFHAGADIGFTTVHSTPNEFAQVLDAHPGLMLVLAHMGGWQQWDDVRRCLLGRDVYLDTAFTLQYLGPEALADLIRAHGAHRVVFGSDTPWADLREALDDLKRLPLPASDLEALLGGTADALLTRSNARRPPRHA
ncbi:MAG: amidohydrolase family protein [Thermoleophilia bacterium]